MPRRHPDTHAHTHTHILELQTATNVAVSPFRGSSVQCVYITRNSNTAHSHTHFRCNHENIVCAHTKWYTGALLLCSGFQKSRFSHSGIPVPHRHPPCHTGIPSATQAPHVPHRHPRATQAPPRATQAPLGLVPHKNPSIMHAPHTMYGT